MSEVRRFEENHHFINPPPPDVTFANPQDHLESDEVARKLAKLKQVKSSDGGQAAKERAADLANRKAEAVMEREKRNTEAAEEKARRLDRAQAAVTVAEWTPVISLYAQEDGARAVEKFFLKQKRTGKPLFRDQLQTNFQAQELLKQKFPDVNMESFLASVPTEEEYFEKLNVSTTVKPYSRQLESGMAQSARITRDSQKEIEKKQARELADQVRENRLEIAKRTAEWKNLAALYIKGGESALQKYLFGSDAPGKRLTQEQLLADENIKEKLEKVFLEYGAGLKIQDFITSMPTEDEYVQDYLRKMTANKIGQSSRNYNPEKMAARHTRIMRMLDSKQLNTEEPYEEMAISSQQLSDEEGIELSDDDILEVTPVARTVNKHVIKRADKAAKSKVAADTFAVPKGVLEELEAIAKTKEMGRSNRPRLEKNSQRAPGAAGEIENLSDIHRPAEQSSQGKQHSSLTEVEKMITLQTVHDLNAQVEKKNLLEVKAAYVAAYRAYDKQFSQNKTDEQIAIMKPPLLAGFLRSANSPGKNLKRLYEELEEAKGHMQNILAAKNLVASSFNKKTESFITPALQQASRESNEHEMRKGVPLKQEKINKSTDNFLSSTEKFQNLKNATSESFSLEELDKSLDEERQPAYSALEEKVDTIKQRLQEIEGYFSSKTPAKKTTRQFLLGKDMGGWWVFGGKDKKLQAEYKQLFNSSVYQQYREQ